jgi:type VI secretion system secreted protein Hcp
MLALLAGVGPLGASEIFLKLAGITGESTAAGHVGEIDVQAWTWSVRKSSSDSPSLGNLRIAKNFDRATHSLMTDCSNGSVISNALLTCRTSGNKGALDFVKVTLSNARVISVQQGGSAGDDTFSETVLFDYERIQIDYTYLQGQIPLTVHYRWTPFDSDEDGMPDEFETRYGLDKTRNDAAEDKDGDGMSNLDEYLAGTDPSQSNSVFRCTLVYAGGTAATLSWSSVAGRQYRVFYAGAVSDTFTPMGDFAGSNSVTQLAVPLSLLPRFYRVQVLPAN